MTEDRQEYTTGAPALLDGRTAHKVTQMPHGDIRGLVDGSGASTAVTAQDREQDTAQVGAQAREQDREQVGSSAPNASGILRGADGRWLPGTARPAGSGNGSGKGKAYRAALQRAIPPEEAAGWVREAVDIARRTGSARGLVQAAALVLGYTVGRPGVAPAEGAERPNLAELLALVPDDVVAGGGGVVTLDGASVDGAE